ncbi:MAG TPA: VapC toxin family PIN domain ribonuclease [Acidimicrobiaceae bacterium]|jgi:predicted nucleic acid-binding protein|nr:VapC toxin family PIN domain ribonuclease [Acidimicrobiaceae bacterium]
MARRPEVLLDTSAAVPLVLADHVAHATTWKALHTRELGLAGHAWFETFSVLTRLPGASRRDAPTVERLISTNFPNSRFLDEASSAALTSDLARMGVSGGAVYDALVAAAAAHHQLPLVSRDRRAAETYRAFNVTVELLD